MAKHRPGEGMTPVAELVGLPSGADEAYAEQLHDMQMSDEEKRELAREVFQERTADADDSWYQEYPEEVDA